MIASVNGVPGAKHAVKEKNLNWFLSFTIVMYKYSFNLLFVSYAIFLSLISTGSKGLCLDTIG